MKLSSTQVVALAQQITKQINESRQKEYNTRLAALYGEIEKRTVEAIKVLGINPKDKLVNNTMRCALEEQLLGGRLQYVYEHDIRNAIVVATIEATDLNTLCETIKTKFQ